MKRITIFLSMLLLICSFNLKAQTQNPIWCMPPYYVKFQGNLPPDTLTLPMGSAGSIFHYGSWPAQYCANAVADKNHKLLFFVIDGVIYNKNGDVIGTTTPNSFNYSPPYTGLNTTASPLSQASACEKNKYASFAMVL